MNTLEEKFNHISKEECNSILNSISGLDKNITLLELEQFILAKKAIYTQKEQIIKDKRREFIDSYKDYSITELFDIIEQTLKNPTTHNNKPHSTENICRTCVKHILEKNPSKDDYLKLIEYNNKEFPLYDKIEKKIYNIIFNNFNLEFNDIFILIENGFGDINKNIDLIISKNPTISEKDKLLKFCKMYMSDREINSILLKLI
jgi:hypothetical protein